MNTFGKMILGSAFATLAMTTTALADTTLNALFMSQAAYSEDDIKSMTAKFEEANPGITVALEFVPYEALHDKIIAAAGAGDDGYDVVLFDVIWPAEFATRGFLQDVTGRIPADYTDKVFDGAWTTVEYDGKRYGMPWILDTKYLFYNTDMLEEAGISAPPKTWAELAEQAKQIKDKGIVEFPLVWSWSQSEAMICDFTTLTAANDGTFFEEGQPAFTAGGAKDAVAFMKATLDEGLTNPSSREYFEEDVRRVFSNGEAAFALNWTYMNALANDPKESKVAGKVKVAPAPGVEGKSTASSVNGSMGLGIPANSPHADEAWAYISFLTQKDVQDDFAKLSLPIWKASYSEPKVVEGQEDLIAAAKESIAVMYPRPLVPSYTEVSDILQKNIHQVLLGQASVDEALEAAASRVKRIR
ncbi:putative sugar uptake ABC transporter periplasmic solute-binding protein precursor [Stappia aggregata IAM 12614]|uniref:Putative sugar uptake ABC transporter periplasmic solute-binding protein n=1 Tax=Roseibium aggregatum (strain ATCC 25650 / DSM 13394 / JCM 20685 / NBRC 16684 / NCIMB 2208 / IAM 12614 / B1) TaxID=384765 RepID=A0P1G5_ROSAI|nr:putative sugar uptake ABC transporter periplasmic solute-binding protein precursor [Stappia aggregata IAM 12614] [Roseibium aggregatum IAM 12614]